MRNIRVLGPSNESRFPVFSRNAYELNIRAVYVCMYKWWSSFRQETMCFPMDLITYVFIAYEMDSFLKENFHTTLMNDSANFPSKVDLLSLLDVLYSTPLLHTKHLLYNFKNLLIDIAKTRVFFKISQNPLFMLKVLDVQLMNDVTTSSYRFQ